MRDYAECHCAGGSQGFYKENTSARPKTENDDQRDVTASLPHKLRHTQSAIRRGVSHYSFRLTQIPSFKVEDQPTLSKVKSVEKLRP